MRVYVVTRDTYGEVSPEDLDKSVCRDGLCIVVGTRDVYKTVLERVLGERGLVEEVSEYIEWRVGFYSDMVREKVFIANLRAPSREARGLRDVYILYSESVVVVLLDTVLAREAGREVVESLRRSLQKRPHRVVNTLVEWSLDLYERSLDTLRREVNSIEERVWREEEVFIRDRTVVRKILWSRRSLTDLERGLIKMRDLVASLARAGDVLGRDLVDTEEMSYVRTEISSMIETIEVYREILLSLIDLDVAFASYKTNEVVKKLTAITLILMPPTLIASIYGMNFDPSVSPWNMPELRHPLGYPIALAAIFLSMWLPYMILRRTGFI